jgi:hypothetical protein
MISTTVEFDTSHRASPPTITLSSIRKITDPKEDQELDLLLLSTTAAIHDEHVSHSLRRFPDHRI